MGRHMAALPETVEVPMEDAPEIQDDSAIPTPPATDNKPTPATTAKSGGPAQTGKKGKRKGKK